MNDSTRKAIEEIKLRTPIEELVRERVPALRRRGRLWEACCPFHEERTPSFKVDPERGTWHCFGACGTGGDAISFVERSQNVEFREALTYLAARAGITLPDRASERSRQEDARHAALYEALTRAAEFYKRALHTRDGERAAAYLRERGLERATIDAFGVGYAPAGGVLTGRARDAGVREDVLIAAGLARKDGGGRTYDFFRDRLMIPIRDLKGRTVGFGGRRLTDQETVDRDGQVAHVPKYVNTAETELFHKGRLIYALDLALEHVRRSGHLILVEGYTDVMAAHQVGLRTVAAVLGTATTDDHAALVRRSGARRVSLVFDGDDAGRKATFKALHGLLSLDVRLDVVRMDPKDDPCDLLVREGPAPMLGMLEAAQPWFEFVLSGLRDLAPTDRARAVDPALELIARLPRAIDRDAHLAELAAQASFPLEVVREQFATLPGRTRERRAAQAVPAPAPRAPTVDPRVARLVGEMAAAATLDASLIADFLPWRERCALPEFAPLFDALERLAPTAQGAVAINDLYTELADAPVRLSIAAHLEHATRANDMRELFLGAQAALEDWFDRRRLDELRAAFQAGDERVMEEIHGKYLNRLQARSH